MDVHTSTLPCRSDSARGRLRRIPSGLVAGLALIAMIVGACSAVAAGEYRRGPRGHMLAMVDDPGCVYCARWRAEVGPAYARSAEGRFAPLTVIQKRDAGAHRLRDVRYTPTFIVFDEASEVGRIVGYPGAEFFWSQLQEILVKAGFDPGETKSPSHAERETRLFLSPRSALSGGQFKALPLR